MALKTILFHAEHDDRFDAILDVACELALSQQGHLIRGPTSSSWASTGTRESRNGSSAG